MCLIPSNDAYEILDNICTCIHENFSISDTVPLKVSSHKGWDSNTKGGGAIFCTLLPTAAAHENWNMYPSDYY